MMSEEEYNKMIQEREAYKKKKIESGNSLVHARTEYVKSIARIYEIDSTKDKSIPDSIFLPDGIMNFYDGEEKRASNFFSRIKKKLFG